MNIKEWRGLRAKRPVFLLPPRESRGGGQGASAALNRRPWPLGTTGVAGERGRVTLGFDSPPQFRWRGPLERSAAAMSAVAGGGRERRGRGGQRRASVGEKGGGGVGV